MHLRDPSTRDQIMSGFELVERFAAVHHFERIFPWDGKDYEPAPDQFLQPGQLFSTRLVFFCSCS